MEQCPPVSGAGVAQLTKRHRPEAERTGLLCPCPQWRPAPEPHSEVGMEEAVITALGPVTAETAEGRGP